MSFCIPDPSSPNISCFAFFKDKQELLKQFINCAELGLHRNSSLLFWFVFYLESNVGSVRSSRRHSGTVNNDAPETRHSARRGWRVCGGAERQRPQLSISQSGRGGPWTPQQRSGDTAAAETSPALHSSGALYAKNH